MCEIISKYANKSIGDKVLEINIGLFNTILYAFNLKHEECTFFLN